MEHVVSYNSRIKSRFTKRAFSGERARDFKLPCQGFVDDAQKRSNMAPLPTRARLISSRESAHEYSGRLWRAVILLRREILCGYVFSRSTTLPCIDRRATCCSGRSAQSSVRIVSRLRLLCRCLMLVQVVRTHACHCDQRSSNARGAMPMITLIRGLTMIG